MAGLMSGMGQGAASGASGGPIGSIIGAGIGGITGYMSDEEKKKREQEARDAQLSVPKRHRMSRILDLMNNYKQQQLAAKTGAAAAGFDWASQMRF